MNFFNIVEKKILFSRRSELLKSQDKSQQILKNDVAFSHFLSFHHLFSLLCIMQSMCFSLWEVDSSLKNAISFIKARD